jgi:hypothetical protein
MLLVLVYPIQNKPCRLATTSSAFARFAKQGAIESAHFLVSFVLWACLFCFRHVEKKRKLIE